MQSCKSSTEGAGRIQSRASIDSAAMALATKLRACLASEVTPNQRVA
jgi:hypothetical protein